MDKKKIIGNTIVFVCILAFIIVFKSIFGEVNTVVGVTVITAALALLQRDLTNAPIENLFKLIVINVASGIFCYIAATNMWIGIPLNLIGLFVIGYVFSSNLKAPIVVAFGLQYMFMLFEPVSGVDFTKRIAALIFGAIFVMVLQFITNATKLRKTFYPTISSVIGEISESISKNKEIPHIFVNLDNLKKMIYEKRKKGFYLSDKTKKSTDIIWHIERIQIIISKNKEDIIKNESFKNYIINSLDEMKKSIDSAEFKNIKLNDYNEETEKEYGELKRNIISLAKDINDIKAMLGKKVYSYEEELPDHFHRLKVAKRNFKMDSLKVSYATRLAIIGAITIFLVQFFKLEEGKWMAFTIFSLIQPYVENTKERSRQRIEGTIIGTIIVIIVFILFKSPSVRGLIVLLAGYLNPFTKGYKSLIVCVTVSAIVSSAIVGGGMSLAITRVIFVACGAVIALLGSKYIIHYKIEDGNNEIKQNYEGLEKQMIFDIENDKSENSIKSLYLLPAFFEEKIKSVNEGEELEKLCVYINIQREKINNMYAKYYYEDLGNKIIN